jgi:tRNA(Ile)-lysidine synthase
MSRGPAELPEISTDFFLSRILNWPAAPRYLVGFSGGVDSHVLLDLAAAAAGRLPGSLAAIHVDHGLSPDSGRWAAHCRRVCDGYAVALEIERIDAAPVAGQSPEARARQLRYGVFRRRLRPGEMLLTAHHRDDQAETVLLQLCRGAGVDGTAAMPEMRLLGAGRHGRPLLPFGRQQIHAHAVARGLEWVEDDSNRDTRFDRNYLRSVVLPLLRARWPAVDEALYRAAKLHAEAAAGLGDLGRQDLSHCLASAGRALDLHQLGVLSGSRRANVLRCWLRELQLPLPAAQHLRTLEAEVIGAAADGNPVLHWPGAEVRRHRNLLFAFPPPVERDARVVISWSLATPLELGHGRLQAVPDRDRGLRRDAAGAGRVEVRFRRGGERLRPAGRHGHRELKSLFQERGIPPWQRDRLPLLYIGEQLAAVAGLWVADEFAARPGEESWTILWQDFSFPER